MKRLAVFVGGVCLVVAFSQAGDAMDLSGRLGLGYSALSPLSGWSVRYWVNRRLGLNGIIDFTLQSGGNEVLIGGRVLCNVREEKNLNIYVGGELGVDLVEEFEDNLSVGAFGGAEYFFSGLPNLGFSAEIGAYYQSGPSAFASGFSQFAIHYYFGGPREKEPIPTEKRTEQVKPAEPEKKQEPVKPAEPTKKSEPSKKK